MLHTVDSSCRSIVATGTSLTDFVHGSVALRFISDVNDVNI